MRSGGGGGGLTAAALMAHGKRLEKDEGEERPRQLAGNKSSLTPLGTALDGQTNSVKKYNTEFVCRQPVLGRWLGTALDGQTNSVKKYRIRMSVINPSSVAGSERHSTARQIQSKSTEFVCPSSTSPRSLARNGARRPDKFSQKVQNSYVRHQPVLGRWLGTALDGQTNSVKMYRVSAVIHFSGIFLQFGDFCASRSFPDSFQIWNLPIFFQNFEVVAGQPNYFQTASKSISRFL